MRKRRFASLTLTHPPSKALKGRALAFGPLPAVPRTPRRWILCGAGIICVTVEIVQRWGRQAARIPRMHRHLVRQQQVVGGERADKDGRAREEDELGELRLALVATWERAGVQKGAGRGKQLHLR